MKRVIILAAAIILTGCQTAEQRAATESQDRAWCQANGSKGNGLSQCMIARENQRFNERQARAAAFARFGAQIQAQQAQQQMIYNQNRPRTTNCYQVSNSVQCTTM